MSSHSNISVQKTNSTTNAALRLLVLLAVIVAHSIAFGNAAHASCVGVCGGVAPSGGCWCDADCCNFMDCCADKCAACGMAHGNCDSIGPCVTPGIHHVPSQYPTIQDAINAAGPGETVLVAPGNYIESITFTGILITVESEQGPLVTKIIAPPGSLAPVVSVINGEPAGTRLEGFTIQDADTNTGGGILVRDAELEIHDCIIQDNHADTGGGLYVAGGLTSPGIVNVTETIFIDNAASDGGGGAYIDFGSHAVFIDCEFLDNIAGFDGGGGVYLGDFSSADVIGTHFFRNTTFGHGGAIHANSVDALLIQSSLFVENESAILPASPGFGGGVYANDFLWMEVADSGFLANKAGAGVSQNEGGGVRAVSPFAPLIIRDTTFDENEATRGGGVYVGHNSGAEFTRVEFNDNFAWEFGGGAAIHHALDVVFDDCTAIGNMALDTGGGIDVQAGGSVLTALITDSWFEDNLAEQSGGGLYAKGDELSLLIDDSRFLQNRAIVNGGGAAILVEFQPPEILNSQFQGNRADEHGGGLYNARAGVLVWNTEFLENGAVGGVWSQGGGVALEDHASRAVFTDCDFLNNTAEDGAGFAAQGGAWVDFLGCSFWTGHAGALSQTTGRGGGGFIAQGVQSVVIDVASFLLNRTENSGMGGGLYSESLVPIPVTNVSFDWNTSSRGGAVANAGSRMDIINALFIDNEAVDIHGSAPYVGGGAIYQFELLGVGSQMHVEDAVFEGNTAVGAPLPGIPGSSGGGAFHHSSGDSTITDAVFAGNLAGHRGGAMFAGEGQVIADRCVFDTNSVLSGEGGAIMAHGGHSVIANSLFVGNLANADHGGAMFIDNATSGVVNCTFFNNEAVFPSPLFTFGHSISAEDSTVHVSNSIVWSEPEPAVGIPMIWEGVNSTVTVTYSCVRPLYAGVGNIDADPEFVAPSAGDLRLQSSSPAIDAGHFAFVGFPLDLDGNTRIQGLEVDMGAYESPGAPWPPMCAADFNQDGTVDKSDLFMVIADWGPTPPGGSPMDMNGDGLVDGADVGILLAHWGGCTTLSLPTFDPNVKLFVDSQPFSGGAGLTEHSLYIEFDDAGDKLLNVYDANLDFSAAFELCDDLFGDVWSYVAIGNVPLPSMCIMLPNTDPIMGDPNLSMYGSLPNGQTTLGTNAGWLNNDPNNNWGLAGNYPGNRVLIGRFVLDDAESITGELSVTYLDAGGAPLYGTVAVQISACPADLDGNTVVNVFDLLELLAAWGPCPAAPAPCPADLDENGVVNVFDLLELLAAWGPC